MTTNQQTESAFPASGYIRMFRLLRTLDVSRATIYRWINAGTFPMPIRLSGSASVFRAEELNAWIEAKKRDRK